MLSRRVFLQSMTVHSFGRPLVAPLGYLLSSQISIAASESVSVKTFGAVGDGRTDDSVACQRAIDSGAKEIVFPPGIYKVKELNITRSMKIINQGDISGIVYIREGLGGPLAAPGKGELKIGQKNIQFNSSHSFVEGDNVALSLRGIGDPKKNQSGQHYSRIAKVSRDSVELEFPVRFEFKRFSCAKFTGGMVANDIKRGAAYIDLVEPLSIDPGTLIRLECLDGSDSPFDTWKMGPVFARNAYFEINVVKKIDGRRLYLDSNTAYAYKSAMLVVLGGLSGVAIEGGKISDVRATDVREFRLSNIDANRVQLTRCFDFKLSGVNVSANGTPIGLGMTWCRNGSVSDVEACCAAGSTDNGNVKIMSGLDIVVNRLVSKNTTAKSQGIYPFFIDFYYTPYNSWSQNIKIDNCKLGAPNGGAQRSLWIAGGRGCTISNVEAEAGFRVEKSKGIDIQNVSVGGLFDFQEVRDLETVKKFSAHALSLAGVERIKLSDGKITGGCRNSPPAKIGRSNAVAVSSDVVLERITFNANCNKNHLRSGAVNRLSLVDVVGGDGKKIRSQKN